MVMSEELTPAEVKVYAEYRKTKGDVDYINGRIVLKAKHALDELYDRKIIDEYAHYAGFDFVRLNDKATVLSSLKRRDDANNSAQDYYPLDVLIAISKALKAWEYTLIKRVCLRDMRENDYKWAWHIRGNVQEAFQSLEKTLASFL